MNPMKIIPHYILAAKPNGRGMTGERLEMEKGAPFFVPATRTHLSASHSWFSVPSRCITRPLLTFPQQDLSPAFACAPSATAIERTRPVK